MSSNIWMQCAGSSELRTLAFTPWRVVEAQHLLSTRKLVDSAAEQELLEEMIDSVKPKDGTNGAFHYLLFTPFRYPPLRHGSRFGTRQERGIWYGSEEKQSAFAEVAYYRLLFIAGSHASIAPLAATLTAFTVRVRSERAIDLTSKPFDEFRATISSPTSYDEAQALGAAMREAGVEIFRYRSARANDGCNVGVFTPLAFHKSKPQKFETWHCTATASAIDFVRADFVGRREHEVFDRARFEIDGALPAPAIA